MIADLCFVGSSATTDDELIRHYTFSEIDLASIRQRRGNHNRLGFAVQLCYLRYPDLALPTQGEPPAPWLAFIGRHEIGPLRQGFAACSSQIRSSTSTPSASARADKVRAEPVRRPLSICDR